MDRHKPLTMEEMEFGVLTTHYDVTELTKRVKKLETRLTVMGVCFVANMVLDCVVSMIDAKK